MSNVKLKVYQTIIITLIVLLTVFSTVGCSNSKNGTATSESETVVTTEVQKEPVELKIFWWGAQDRHTATMEACELFEQKNSDITVTTEFAGWDGYMDKLRTQFAAQTAPDVVQLDFAFVISFSMSNQLLPLDEYIGKELIVSDINEDILESDGKLNGKYYAIPAGLTAQVFAMNKTVLDSLGIQPPSNDWSWEDFHEICKNIYEKSDQKIHGSIDISAEGSGSNVKLAIVYLKQKGESLFDESGPGFTDETFSGFLNLWNSMRKDGSATPPTLTASHNNNTNNLVAKGNAVFSFIPSSTYNKIKELTKDTINLVLVPGSKDGGSMLSSSVLYSVNASSPHPDEAVKLLNFLINDTDASNILKTVRGIPASKKIRDYLINGGNLSDIDKEGFEIINLASEKAFGIGFVPKGIGPLFTDYQRISEKVNFGELKLENALEEYKKAIQNAYK